MLGAGGQVRVTKLNQNRFQLTHPHISALFVVRLEALCRQINPMDGLSSQPLNYVHN